jgi:hypothetical protein
VNGCLPDAPTQTVVALACYIDPESDEMSGAYPGELLTSLFDGRAMMSSVLALSIGSNLGIDDVGYGKFSDIYFPPKFLVLAVQADSAGS